MLRKNFNKFGGTEFRVKSQLFGYITVFEWIKSVKELLEEENGISKKDLSRKLEEYEWDKKFKEWAFEQHIYHYKSTKHNIDRFTMLCSSLKKLGIFDKDKPLLQSLNKEIDMNSVFQSMQNYKNSLGVKPFKELLKFVHDHPDKNDSRKIILAFLVFDGEESFHQLYETDVFDALTKHIDENSSLPSFRKPINSFRYLKMVFNAKKHNQKIVPDDFRFYNYKNDNYLRKVVFKPRSKFNLSSFIYKLNKMTLSELLKKIHIIRYKNLLLGDYFDLFSRWLFDFKLIDKSGKKTSKFFNSRIIYKGGQYLLDLPTITPVYPFTYDETVKYLEEIAKGNIMRYKMNTKLKETADCAIAEYFVNLFYCYQLKIKPEDFRKYAYTKVTDELIPYFTAPGRNSDMSYIFNDIIINIETTTLNTETDIREKEMLQCIRHLRTNIEKANQEFRKEVLVFVSPVVENVIIEAYKWNLENRCKNAKLKIYTFGNLVEKAHELLDVIKE